MPKRAEELNLGLATAVAPLSIPLLVLLAILIFTDETIGGLNGLVILWATLASYAGCLFLGIPVVHLLKWRNSLTVVALCLSGFLAGMVVTFPFSIVLGATVGFVGVEHVKMEGVMTFGLAGAIVGTVFGFVAKARLY